MEASKVAHSNEVIFLTKISALWGLVEPAAYDLNYFYHQVNNISIEGQFLITLIKLRRAATDFELVINFNCSGLTIQNIFII